MKSKNLNLMLILLAFASIIAVISLLGFFQISNEKNIGNVTLIITVFNDSKFSKYNFENMTALELLQMDNEVNTTYSKYGAFVNCINNICTNSNYYWMYYVNGGMASVGVSEYKIKDNDIVEFKYGKIE